MQRSFHFCCCYFSFGSLENEYEIELLALIDIWHILYKPAQITVWEKVKFQNKSNCFFLFFSPLEVFYELEN